MGKFILFLLIAVAVYWWLRRHRPAVGGDDAETREVETMVSCAYCGLHVPLKESVSGAGRYYCGEEHRRLDAGR